MLTSGSISVIGRDYMGKTSEASGGGNDDDVYCKPLGTGNEYSCLAGTSTL